MLPLRNLGEKLVHVSPPGLVPVVLGVPQLVDAHSRLCLSHHLAVFLHA